MFTNFFYTIIVLLLYLAYHPPETPHFSALETVFLFLGLTFLFYALTVVQFRGVMRRISLRTDTLSGYVSDLYFNTVMRRQSVSAVVLFVAGLYWLHLPWYVSKISIVAAIPTVQGLLFIALFMAYLSVIWYLAYPAYQIIYRAGMTRSAYIHSNIRINFPIILPWFFFSGIIDIIERLPFEQPRHFLSTPMGEVAYALVFLLSIALLGPVVIQKMWRCRPLEQGPVRSRIRNLCAQAGLVYTDILYWPIFGGRMITAGVMGLVKRARYLLVTRALLQFLEPEDLDAVIAHEIGHVKHKHLLWYLVFFSGYLLFSYTFLELFVYLILYVEPLQHLFDITNREATTTTSLGFSLVAILIFFIYFRYIFGYFMRNFERQADTYVFQLLGNAQSLISAFHKITTVSGVSPRKPNWHHFSISERIAYLQRCEQDRSWIEKHRTKVKRGVIIYLACCLLTAILTYQLNFGHIGTTLSAHHLEKILLAAVEKTPHDPDLFSTLGDLYYQMDETRKAMDAYSRSLHLDPDNPEILNNLAWLHATTEDTRLHDPARALLLARKAVDLKPSAHIFDTLAESYFINGKYALAVEAATMAVRLSRENKRYYAEQLERFRKAAQRPR